MTVIGELISKTQMQMLKRVQHDNVFLRKSPRLFYKTAFGFYKRGYASDGEGVDFFADFVNRIFYIACNALQGLACFGDFARAKTHLFH